MPAITLDSQHESLQSPICSTRPMIDENTRVRISPEYTGIEIQLWQGEENMIVLGATNSSPANMAEGISAAIQLTKNEVDFDMPDLTNYGYKLTAT